MGSPGSGGSLDSATVTLASLASPARAELAAFVGYEVGALRLAQAVARSSPSSKGRPGKVMREILVLYGLTQALAADYGG